MRNSPGPESPFKALSERERQVIGLAAAGFVDKQIGQELDVSVNTLRTYWSRIREKVGDGSRPALVAAYVTDELTSAVPETLDPMNHEGWIMDADTRMMLATDTINDDHGLERGVPHPMSEYGHIIHPEDVDQGRDGMLAVAEGRLDSVLLLYRIVTPRGVELVNASVHGIKNEQGSVIKVFGFRVRALDCRPGHDSSIQIGHWERDYPEEVFTIDSGLAEIIGRSGTRTLTMADVGGLLGAGAVDAHGASTDHAVEHGLDRIEGDLRFIRPDGEVVWSRITRRIVRSEDGGVKVFGTLVVFR